MAGKEAKEALESNPALALFPPRLALTVTPEDLAGPQDADNHALCRAAQRVGYGWAWHHGATLEVGFTRPRHAQCTYWCAHYIVPAGPLIGGPLTLARLRVEDWTDIVHRHQRRGEARRGAPPKIAPQSATTAASRTRESVLTPLAVPAPAVDASTGKTGTSGADGRQPKHTERR